ncbi:MAG: histidine kinase [Muribaculaceae bacterium]|nr:histidine kinase [Muribaculaceae bacterium]
MLLGKIPVVDWAELYMVDFLILLVHEVAYFVISYRLAESKANEVKSHMAQLQYDVLKAQVNPHFLFNSLNLLYSLNAIDKDKAQKFILSLAKLYNYIMRQHEHQKVSLKEELEQLNFYIEVLKMRYWQQFDVEIRGLGNVLNQQIVPASLQMLMENVTKHNVITTDDPMKVLVEIFPDKLIITNPMRPKVNDHVSKSGIGLRYLKRAYGDLGEKFSYINDGKNFIVTIPLFN